MEPTNNFLPHIAPVDALSIAERITRMETVLVFLTEQTKVFQSELKNIHQSLYGGITCNGIDTLLNEIQGQLGRMEVSLQELEDGFEEKLFETLWKGLCRQLSAIAKDHVIEILLGAVGMAVALFKLLVH